MALLRMLFSVALPPLLLVFYGVVFVLALFVPKDFLSVAFDSGGVASGPMTTTFLLPLSIGVCQAVGGNIMTDAFGVVALVALTPLIAVQIMGLVYKHKMDGHHKNVEQSAGLYDNSDMIVDFEEDEVNEE